MTLRDHAVERDVKLPDGRTASIRIGLARDSYIRPSELDTIALELHVEGQLEAVLDTVLDADNDGEARRLVGEIATGLEDGSLTPTAGALEPFADRLD